MEKVYHYTTLTALMGMLSNPIEMEGEKSLIMWASSILTLNDPTEFKLGYNHIKSKLLIIEKELQIEDKYKISSIFQDKTKAKDIDNMFLENMHLSNYLPYVISFSKKGDFLPMWKMYGDNAKGVCLCFNNMEYKYLDNNIFIENKVNAIDVCYGGLNFDYDNFLYRWYKKFYKDAKNNRNKLFEKKIEYVIAMFVACAPLIKNVDYQYEDEVRLVKCAKNENCVLFRQNVHGSIVPYIEVPIPIKYLIEIKIGPCSDYNSIKGSLLHMLKAYGVEKRVKIISSSVSYRE